MKAPHIFFIISCLTLAVWIYHVDSKTQTIITVDTTEIIFRTAKSLAKKNLNEDELQRHLIHFKKGLESSLKEFADKKGAIVLPKTAVYGNLKDETQAFIAYHNGEENASA